MPRAESQRYSPERVDPHYSPVEQAEMKGRKGATRAASGEGGGGGQVVIIDDEDSPSGLSYSSQTLHFTVGQESSYEPQYTGNRSMTRFWAVDGGAEGLVMSLGEQVMRLEGAKVDSGTWKGCRDACANAKLRLEQILLQARGLEECREGVVSLGNAPLDLVVVGGVGELEEDFTALEREEESASHSREYETALEIKGRLDEKRATILAARVVCEAVAKSRELLGRY